MKRIIVQLYEIQDPHEAERLIGLGVDRIGSVILSPEAWKVPAVRDVVRLVRGSGAKSSLIPLLAREDDILRALDYYQPDFVHFCELIPLDPGKGEQRKAICVEMIRLQRRVKKEFPPLGITRSIPIPEPGPADPAAVRETILEIARMLEPHTDGFMTDTLRGYEKQNADQPVAGYVGITGEVCDWDLAAALVKASRISVILAGGISPENVFDAIDRVKPAGIDSCTQTNARDHRGRPIRFRKDFDRIRRLLDEVRRAEEMYSNLRPSAL
jgi:phosphoribosylanthranilate isomerase